MTTRVGRPKGTRVVACRCGRRLAGGVGRRVRCPGCQRRVTVVERGTGGKPRRVFLPSPPGTSERP